MYNRYIPQEDGSYTRNRMQDAQSVRQNTPSPPPPPAPDCSQNENHPPMKEPSKTISRNPGGFLKQLLPKGFDTGDLIIILLLLLMAGDCEEDKNNAILTIALYFLM